MQNNIHNDQFRKNQIIDDFSKNEDDFWKKASIKANLSNVIKKFQSNLEKEVINKETDIEELKGRVSDLRLAHESKMKSSFIFRAMTKVLNVFGWNILKDCKNLENLINVKQDEAKLIFQKIPEEKLTKTQKEIIKIIETNKKWRNQKLYEYYMSQPFTSQQEVLDDIIKILVRNTPENEIKEFIEASIISGLNHLSHFNSFTQPLPSILCLAIEKSQVNEKKYLRDFVMKYIVPQDLNKEISREELQKTIFILNTFSEEDASRFILKVYREGSYNTCKNIERNVLRSDVVLKYTAPSDLEDLPKEQLYKIIKLDYNDYVGKLNEHFDQKVAETLFKDKSTSIKTLETLQETYVSYAFRQDFHEYALKKIFEYGLKPYNFEWKGTPDEFVEKIIEIGNKPSNNRFLLWASSQIGTGPLSSGPVVGDIKKLLGTLVNHISTINEGKNAAEVIISEFTKALKEENPNIIENLEKALGEYIRTQDIFYSLRDKDSVSNLLDALLSDNDSSDVFRMNEAKNFFNRYLNQLELPKESELYTFVFTKLLSKYSSTRRLSLHKYSDINEMSKTLMNEVTPVSKGIPNTGNVGESFSFDVFEKLSNEQKPLYINLNKPWVEDKLLNHLNGLDLNDDTALVFEVIAKDLRNCMLAQLRVDKNIIKKTTTWNPEMLLLFFSAALEQKEDYKEIIDEIKNKFTELNIVKQDYVIKLLDFEKVNGAVAKELLSSLFKLDGDLLDNLPDEMVIRINKLLLKQA